MQAFWPHEFFRIDFDTIVEQGKRQEEIHPANQGEHAFVREMRGYFARDILPLIAADDRVYGAAMTFAPDYAVYCFRCLRLGGREVSRSQRELHELHREVEGFIREDPGRLGAGPRGTINLTKASDFIKLLDLRSLEATARARATELLDQAKEQEALLLTVTLRANGCLYETVLPRVMYVVRRAMKVHPGLRRKPGDDTLTGISQDLDWYAAHVDIHHALYPVLGELRGFYRVARNVGSHHLGLEWDPESDQVVLTDKTEVVGVDVHEFQQRYRYLVYACS